MEAAGGSLALSIEENDPLCSAPTRRPHEKRPRRLSWAGAYAHVWRSMAMVLLGLCLGLLVSFSFLGLRSSSSTQANEQQEDLRAPHHKPLKFLVVGDWGRLGLYNQSQVAIQMGRIGEELDIQFVISTGDNFYETGLKSIGDPAFTTSFTNVFTAPSLQKKWYAVLGNHDYMGDTLSQLSDELTMRDPRWSCRREFELHFSLCPAPNSTGTCNASVDMFFIDTTPFINEYWVSPSHSFDWRGLAPREKQLNVQLESLAHKLQSSNATWKIAIGHHTIRSVGHHGDSPELLNQVLPVLEKYRVDLYVNGHDHNLQHIKRSDRSGKLQKLLLKLIGVYFHVSFVYCSPVHFVTSGGGSKAFKGLRSFNKTAGVKFVFDGQGFLAVSMEENTLSFTFYDVFGKSLYSSFLKK